MDEDFRKRGAGLPPPADVPENFQIEPTKRMATPAGSFALAYSPGVAAACEEIKRPTRRHTRGSYTTRGNLVGVISNGTAVLGLGNIGPLASKPVMEGKAVLFKKFAGIDVFDIEVDAQDPARVHATVVAALEPTFGAINLEDIKAPECFEIEKRRCGKRMRIPVFHDDQHGTAIIGGGGGAQRAGAAGQEAIEDMTRGDQSGAGAAALACVDLLVRDGAAGRRT